MPSILNLLLSQSDEKIKRQLILQFRIIGIDFWMLSIPNDGYDTPNIEKNILWCEGTFTELGFDVERVILKVLANDAKSSAINCKQVYIKKL